MLSRSSVQWYMLPGAPERPPGTPLHLIGYSEAQSEYQWACRGVLQSMLVQRPSDDGLTVLIALGWVATWLGVTKYGVA
jgi:hypothetical protein